MAVHINIARWYCVCRVWFLLMCWEGMVLRMSCAVPVDVLGRDGIAYVVCGSC